MSLKIHLKAKDLESRLSPGAVPQVILWKPYVSGELTRLLTSLQLSGMAVPMLSWLLRVPGEASGCQISQCWCGIGMGQQWGKRGFQWKAAITLVLVKEKAPARPSELVTQEWLEWKVLLWNGSVGIAPELEGCILFCITLEIHLRKQRSWYVGLSSRAHPR